MQYPEGGWYKCVHMGKYIFMCVWLVVARRGASSMSQICNRLRSRDRVAYVWFARSATREQVIIQRGEQSDGSVEWRDSKGEIAEWWSRACDPPRRYHSRACRLALARKAW